MVDRTRLLSDRTDLDIEDRQHLRALVADWVVLADLSFSDLVLWVPTWDGGGFTAVAQVRPSTGPSVIPGNMINEFIPAGRQLLLDRALASGQIEEDRGGSDAEADRRADSQRAEGVRVRAIPVNRNGRTIAVLESKRAPRLAGSGPLEQVYRETAGDIAAMIVSGDFPGDDTLASTDSPPRVGDGLIRLDRDGVVQWASPNAVSAFYRVGLSNDLVDAKLSKLVSRSTRGSGLADEGLPIVTSGSAFGTTTVSNEHGAMLLTSLPLVRDGERFGAVVFARDVTDLREREQALLTKDATIREIHHRVKNNLQTVSALLRLQSRRIDDLAGQEALAEAVRRVGAIAVVHEMLANEASGETSFDEVTDRIVAMTVDLAQGTKIRRVGTAGYLSSETTTALAMVLAEVLANAVRHGVGGSDGTGESAGEGSENGEIELSFDREQNQLTVTVADSGAGMPANFDVEQSQGLGLQIVRALVQDELKGSVRWHDNEPSGTRVVIEVAAD
ncbi:MAG: sensor histidine kinase [Candidatus Nanopelagicales bacterium]